MTDKTETAVNEDKKVRTITGRVTSNKMDKTIAVSIERKFKHPLYGKYLRRSTKFMAHDEENTCNEGDLVSLVECSPFSKNKSWRLFEVLERARANV